MSECDWCDGQETDEIEPITGTPMCPRCRADLAAGIESEFVEIERAQR